MYTVNVWFEAGEAVVSETFKSLAAARKFRRWYRNDARVRCVKTFRS